MEFLQNVDVWVRFFACSSAMTEIYSTWRATKWTRQHEIFFPNEWKYLRVYDYTHYMYEFEMHNKIRGMEGKGKNREKIEIVKSKIHCCRLQKKRKLFSVLSISIQTTPPNAMKTFTWQLLLSCWLHLQMIRTLITIQTHLCIWANVYIAIYCIDWVSSQ